MTHGMDRIPYGQLCFIDLLSVKEKMSMDINFEWLEDHIFHRHLDAKEQGVLAQSIQMSELRKGDVLVDEGDHRWCL